MRPRPDRLERLPEQYFTSLLRARRGCARGRRASRCVDLGRGNPEVGPPPHVVERLAEAARDRPRARLPALPRPARAARGDRGPLRVASTASSSTPSARSPSSRGRRRRSSSSRRCSPSAARRSSSPTPATRTTRPASRSRARASSRCRSTRRPAGGPTSTRRRATTSRPSTSTTRRTRAPPASPPAPSPTPSRFAGETGAAIVHDFAYGDLVFDGRQPESFLAEPGAKDVGVEMFRMSKSVRHGRLAARLRRRQRGDRRPGQPAPGPRPRRDLPPGAGGRRSPR